MYCILAENTPTGCIVLNFKVIFQLQMQDALLNSLPQLVRSLSSSVGG